MNEANAGFLQLLVPDIAANKMVDGTPATWEKMLAGKPAKLGAYIALGPARLAALWPDLQYAHEDPLGITHGLTCWKMGHGKASRRGERSPDRGADQYDVEPRPDVPYPHQLPGHRAADVLE